MKEQATVNAERLDAIRILHRRPVLLTLLVGGLVYGLETLVMIALRETDLPFLQALVLDGAVLLVLLVPLLYFFLIKPIARLIVEQSETARALKETADYKNAILENMIDAVITINARGIVLYINRSGEKLFGCTSDELVGQNISRLMPSPHRENHDHYLERYAAGGHPRVIGIGREVTAQRLDGACFPADLSVAEMQGPEGRVFIGILRDISARHEAEKALRQAHLELEFRVQERTAQLVKLNQELTAEVAERERIQRTLDTMARTDALTGLLNRREADTILNRELDRASRYRQPLSLILFDVDHFKRVNDTYGHLAGDTVLVELSALVAPQLRSQDEFARWGGEEFVICCPGTSLEGACAVAEKLRASIAAHTFPSIERLTCSFGVTSAVPPEARESFISRADKALYQSKAAGRNQVTCASSEPRAALELC